MSIYRAALGAMLIALVGGTLAQAQKPDKPVVEKPAAEKPAAEKPAPAAEAPTAEAPAGEATARYNKLFEDWKNTLRDLRKLRSTMANAKPDQAKELEDQWQGLVAQGNKLLPELREAGRQAYGEGAAVDPQLQRFLLKLTQDLDEHDDYEAAFGLAKAILDRSEREQTPPPKELYNFAGLAAFNINEFDAAEKLFDMAEEAGTLKPENKGRKGDIKKYQKYWAVESALRDAEAKTVGTPEALPRVKVSTTAGDMVIELFENEAPDTVGNFISLVESKFYDGLDFHRVLEHFMAQGGDPKGNGTGGPGWEIYCETGKKYPDARRHFRGTLSMAHAGQDTGGSQFFLCFTPQEMLDGKHTAFGRVVEGFDTLSKIQRFDPDKADKAPPGLVKTKIISMEVLNKRDHTYQPKKVN